MADYNSRYNASIEIFNALAKGRTLSQLDAREFRVVDMRTPVSHMRKRIDNEGYVLKWRWIKTLGGKNIKEYWIEKVNNE